MKQVTEKGYIICPHCKQKTKTKVNSDTLLINFPLWCGWCKTESIIDYPVERPKTETY